MAQAHLDRLTAIDASFLVQETPTTHMHVGAVIVCEGPAPLYTEFVDGIRGRLHLVPRYRQRLVAPPLDSGRPMWADDPTFNLEYHVRHTALPSPGSEEQLLQLAARVHSQQLDRYKPLWECWLVEGLEGGRFALLFKTHHALVDGVAGVDLATVLFDLSPDPPDTAPEGLEPWHPRPDPSSAELLAAGVKGLVKASVGAASQAVTAATRPSTSLGVVREAAEGIGEIVWAGLNPAPETPLNVEIGPHRRYAIVRGRLEEYKEVKNALGGTVNDVVLTVVSGALAKWLRSRGVRTEGLEMRALVPVSIRQEHQHHQMGNRIAAMRGPLPVYIKDPVARLRFVKQAMDGLKDSKQAVGAEVLAGVQQLAPPTVLAQASRLNFSTRLFNLLVTNVPGPQFPLYVSGRRMLDLFPIAFLPKDHALAIAIMSYDGGVNFGLLGDYDALPDIDAIANGLEESLLELRQAAAKKTGGTKTRTAPTPRPKGTARTSGPAAEMRAKRRPKSRAGSASRNGGRAKAKAKTPKPD